MSKSWLLSLLLLVFPQAFAAEPRVFGAEMPEGEARPVSVVIAAATLPEAALKLTGRITEVCQAKGCWVMLEDDGQVARVMMHEHAFSVPKDSAGRTAVVYGTVSVEQLDAKTAKHLGEDAGSDQSAPAREYRIDALSIALTDA